MSVALLLVALVIWWLASGVSLVVIRLARFGPDITRREVRSTLRGALLVPIAMLIAYWVLASALPPWRWVVAVGWLLWAVGALVVAALLVVAYFKQRQETEAGVGMSRSTQPPAGLELPVLRREILDDLADDSDVASTMSIEALGWTEFWAWARRRGLTTREDLNVAAGERTNGLTPAQIRQRIETRQRSEVIERSTHGEGHS